MGLAIAYMIQIEGGEFIRKKLEDGEWMESIYNCDLAQSHDEYGRCGSECFFVVGCKHL